MTLVARTDGAGRPLQTLAEHAAGVASLCKVFGEELGSPLLLERAGQLHDIGKALRSFQAHLLPGGPEKGPDHACIGAWLLWNLYDSRWAEMLAYAVCGHHAGLPDGKPEPRQSSDATFEKPTLEARLDRAEERNPRELLRRAQKEGVRVSAEPLDVPAAKPVIRPGATQTEARNSLMFSATFWTRIAFSVLVDADRLDAARAAGEAQEEPNYADMRELCDRIEARIQSKGWDTEPKSSKPLSAGRYQLLQAASACAPQAPGWFALSGPTGSGKTVSGARFSVSHAKIHGMRRIIYCAPFRTIVDQTADTLTELFGEDSVLCLHGGIDAVLEGLSTPQVDLCAERFDAPIVCTTVEQALEPLLGAHPGECRRLHNMTNSVIVVDEAQALPEGMRGPTLRALSEMVANYGCSVLFTSATQPALATYLQDLAGVSVTEICPDPSALHRACSRCTYREEGQLSLDDLGSQLCSQGDGALVILNTRRAAQHLFDLLTHDDRFCLTTLQTGLDRARILEEVKTRLKEGGRVCLVATNLVEAGVDIDFPAVWRELDSLEHVVQAGGRCNREGLRNPESSFVHVFRQPGTQPGDCLAELQRAISAGLVGDPAWMEGLIYSRGRDIDAEDIVERLSCCAPDSVPFHSVAHDYRFIDKPEVSVVVPSQVDPETLERLRGGKYRRKDVRTAARASFRLLEKEAKRFDGILHSLNGSLLLLTDESRYDSERGFEIA